MDTPTVSVAIENIGDIVERLVTIVEHHGVIVERLVAIACAPTGLTPSDLLNLREEVFSEAFGDNG
jgi:hypothetical protein